MCAEINGFHLIERQGNWARRISVSLTRHEIGKLAISAKIFCRKIRVNGVGIIAKIDVEGDIANFSCVIGSDIGDTIIESQLGSMNSICCPSRCPCTRIHELL